MKSSFSFNGSYTSFQNFAQAVEGASLEGNKITVSSAATKGTVERADVEQGLSVINWDLEILEDYLFINSFSPIDDQKYYMLNYFLEPEYTSITYQDGNTQCYTDRTASLLVMSDSADIEFSFPEGSHLGCITICFTHGWLLRQLVDVNEEKMVSSYLMRILQSIQLREMAKIEVIYTMELCKELRQSGRALLIKTQIFNLLSFLYRHVAFKAHLIKKKNLYTERMVQVEKLLIAHLSIGMPSLDELAAKFYMSTSTLLRQFKNVFGTSVYDYFIHKKMELARQLLRQDKNVNEVAFILGYENVSNFIAMFKKRFGYSPGKENTR